LHQYTSRSKSLSDDSDDGSFPVVSCDTPGCCCCSLGRCRVSPAFLYSGKLMIARRCGVSFSQKGTSGKRIHIVNLRLGATSTTCGSLLGLDLRKEICCWRNCSTPFERRRRPSSGCACRDYLGNGRRVTTFLRRECHAGCCEPPFAGWFKWYSGLNRVGPDVQSGRYQAENNNN